MDPIDLHISRKLKRFLARCEKLAAHEFGTQVGLSICVHPTPKEPRIAEFQYVSNLPRYHMKEAFRAVVKKWEACEPDIPPHERN